MDSTVCSITPSSAATTRTTKSVTFAPRALMAVKAAWPGVSRKVIVSPLLSFTMKHTDDRQILKNKLTVANSIYMHTLTPICDRLQKDQQMHKEVVDFY
jgi:hypothetical protein